MCFDPARWCRDVRLAVNSTGPAAWILLLLPNRSARLNSRRSSVCGLLQKLTEEGVTNYSELISGAIRRLIVACYLALPAWSKLLCPRVEKNIGEATTPRFWAVMRHLNHRSTGTALMEDSPSASTNLINAAAI